VRTRFASTCRLLAYPFVVEVPLSPQQIDLRFVARRASRCWRRSSSSHRHRSIFVGFFLLGVSIEFQVFCRTRQRFSQTRNSYALPPYQWACTWILLMETPKRKKPTKMLRCRWLDELRRQQRLARRATNRKSICCGESGTSTTNGYASNLHVLAKRVRTRMNGRVTNYLWSKFADLRLSFRKWTIWKNKFCTKPIFKDIIVDDWCLEIYEAEELKVPYALHARRKIKHIFLHSILKNGPMPDDVI
jgi:hypothetical protein